MQIIEHPILGKDDRNEMVTITVDGMPFCSPRAAIKLSGASGNRLRGISLSPGLSFIHVMRKLSVSKLSKLPFWALALPLLWLLPLLQAEKPMAVIIARI